jgi:hypothetical protein
MPNAARSANACFLNDQRSGCVQRDSTMSRLRISAIDEGSLNFQVVTSGMSRREALMRIIAMSEQECSELLGRVSFGRLACSLNDQPYIVPVDFSYEPDRIYVFSTAGKKIEWMRENPKVCLQADEIGNRSNWLSVIVTGTFLELREPQYTAEREHALEQLAQYSQYWLNPLAERREQTSDLSIEPVFFRVDINSISGLRATE